MNEAKISWYSMSLGQKVEEHEPIDLKQAIQIADRYLGRGDEKFKSDKEALAATMFGFSKSKADFIEICIFGPTQFSYRFQFSNPATKGLQKLMGRGFFQLEEDLQSRDELILKVTEFFSHNSQEIAEMHNGKPRRSLKSPLGNSPNTSIGKRIFVILLVSAFGLFMAYFAVQGIIDGKTHEFAKHSHGYNYRYKNPIEFWLTVVFFFAVSVWSIRNSLLELKIVRKKLKERNEKKLKLFKS